LLLLIVRPYVSAYKLIIVGKRAAGGRKDHKNILEAGVKGGNITNGMLWYQILSLKLRNRATDSNEI